MPLRIHVLFFFYSPDAYTLIKTHQQTSIFSNSNVFLFVCLFLNKEHLITGKFNLLYIEGGSKKTKELAESQQSWIRYRYQINKTHPMDIRQDLIHFYHIL